jgi:5'-deoxynucleotidase
MTHGNLTAVMQSGYCTRWHANPSLAHIRETLAEHHGRVAQIICALHPNPSANLIKAALHHDCGEMIVGDLPWPFKQRNAGIADAHAEIEAQVLQDMGVAVALDPREHQWLKLADRLASVMHVAHVAPDLLRRDGWPDDVSRVVNQAQELGCMAEVCNAISRTTTNTPNENLPFAAVKAERDAARAQYSQPGDYIGRDGE